MQLVYQARFVPNADGHIYVSFPDVPEAITFGSDEADACRQAADALATALLFRTDDGMASPPFEAHPDKGLRAIEVPVDIATKIEVIEAFRGSGLSKGELAKRLGKTEGHVQRLLDPHHGIENGQALAEALSALGYHLSTPQEHDGRHSVLVP